MIAKYKAYRLRKKAAKLEREIEYLTNVIPVIQGRLNAQIMTKRAAVMLIERKLQAMGSAIKPDTKIISGFVIAILAIALLGFMDDAPQVAQIEADRLAALTHKAQSDRLMRQSNALVYPLAQVGVK